MDILKKLNYINEEELASLNKYIKPVVKNHHGHEVGYINSILNLKREVNK
jgi:hypothetical protein